MTDLLPITQIGDPNPPVPKQTSKAVARATNQGERELALYAIRAAVDREMDFIDSRAASDVVLFAAECELGVYDRLRPHLDHSVVAQQIVARKLEVLASIDDDRILRRFG